MDGVLNINKPRGSSSFSIVSAVRRLSGERRVGHAGTLDREATGVLPVCLGRATRVSEFLMATTKKYCAVVELGVTTDTYDSTGKIVRRGDTSGIDRERLEETLRLFQGRILQTPPMYSAVKYHGRPLHELARAGMVVERKSRKVEIHSLEMIGWQSPLATLEVVCSKGTYIRSLAHDLGEALGCAGMLRDLVRLRCGLFEVEHAVSMPELEVAFRQGCWQRYLYSIDDVLSHWKSVTVDDEMAQAIKNGQLVCLDGEANTGEISPPVIAADSHCRAYTRDGCLLALLRFKPGRGMWQPDKVFQ